MNTTIHPMTWNSTQQERDIHRQIFWPLVETPIAVEFLISIHVITMVISIPGNMLTSFLIIRNHNLREEPAYLLICSVSCADLMVSMIGQPLTIWASTQIHSGMTPTFELLLYFTIWGFCGASAFGVVFITVDRFLCIIYPMHYKQLLDKRKTCIMIIAQWVCGLGYGILPIIDMKKSAFPTAVASLVTLLLMTISMTAIYTEVYRNIRRLKTEKPTKSRSKSRQNNATLTIALIVLAFFVCWFPYIITNFILTCIDFRHNSPIYGTYYWFLGLGCWNSALNVIIYGFKNTTLRREARKLFVFKDVTPSFFLSSESQQKKIVQQNATIHTIHDPKKQPKLSFFRTKKRESRNKITVENSDAGMTNYDASEGHLQPVEIILHDKFKKRYSVCEAINSYHEMQEISEAQDFDNLPIADELPKDANLVIVMEHNDDHNIEIKQETNVLSYDNICSKETNNNEQKYVVANIQCSTTPNIFSHSVV